MEVVVVRLEKVEIFRWLLLYLRSSWNSLMSAYILLKKVKKLRNPAPVSKSLTYPGTYLWRVSQGRRKRVKVSQISDGCIKKSLKGLGKSLLLIRQITES